ncbi:hypothetical protein SERLA73DRAFT_180944 [Serpula lacrymans var. lacrymans S7.3]|uniref:Protein SQS1 n=1 Tax=Serpula lacrymans var. lacrymans (strain S7.3) TaxID=936435 RepID=F8PWP2_SERL3|nr:hypothetical protein SERLA73DRAFT_180944 [Serpula lacrymans var. lacrymans S7.3]
MRQEDEEEQESDSHGSESDTEDDGDISDSEEQEMVFAVEEEIMIAEADGEDFQEDVKSQDEVSEEDNSSDDDDQSPKSGFQARLKRLHDKARVRKTADYNPESEVESSDEDPPWTRADGDNRYIAHIEAMLEENSHIINGHDRKERKALFRAIEEGTLDDFYETDDGFHTTPSKRNKQKKKSIPIELQSQWEKDRLKKAEYKRMRNEARLLAAMDPLTPKKGGKKGRKASLAAALLDDAMPNKVVDLVSLDRQIRRFIADLGGRQEMVLPPMDKSSRKVVHELANAFNLKSMSKGRGKHRYTTLIKTTRTGINVREGKIRGILRRTGGGRFDRPDDRGSGKGKGTDRAQAPRHRDGDEVGKAAPKIGENNIGFKMLASMGWSEGERIGVSSFGLHAPLTAVIKNTKSGLGATR